MRVDEPKTWNIDVSWVEPTACYLQIVFYFTPNSGHESLGTIRGNMQFAKDTTFHKINHYLSDEANN